MKYPEGSIVGLCYAASFLASIGLAFLGYWDANNVSPFNFGREWPVVVPAVGGIAVLILVPFLVTARTADGRPGEGIGRSRRLFLLGALLVLLAPVFSIVLGD